jgi:hypothetical protein
LNCFREGHWGESWSFHSLFSTENNKKFNVGLSVISFGSLQVQYAKDCDKLYGRILDTPVVNPADRETATDATRTLWQSKFQDEPYDVDISEARDAPVVQKQDCDGGNEALPTVIPSNVANRITYNLVDAVSRQKSFYYQVSFAITISEKSELYLAFHLQYVPCNCFLWLGQLPLAK